MVEDVHDEICGTVREKSHQISAELAESSETWRQSKARLVDDALASLSPAVQAKLKQLLQDAEQQMDNVKALAGEKQAAFDEYKRATEERVRLLVERLVVGRLEQAFELAGDELKEALKEEDMPELVQRAVDRSVDFWLGEIGVEVQRLVLEKTRETSAGWDQGEPVAWCPNPFRKARAAMLYSLLPYDRSVWSQLRDPVWWLLFVVVACPVYGVSQVFFFVLYLLKDNQDEFQLMEFIFGFKVGTFLSQGLVALVVGAALYVGCSNKAEPSCDSNGPAQYPLFVFEMAVWCMQVLLLWWAGLQLRYTVKKGQLKIKLTQEEQREWEAARETDCCGNEYHASTGQRVRSWVVYDLVVFVLCAGVVAFAAFREYHVHEDLEEDWKALAVMYWMRTVYGLMSLPWVLLRLPGIFTVYTHAAPTGYNQNGMVVPMMSADEQKQRQVAGLQHGSSLKVAPEPQEAQEGKADAEMPTEAPTA